MRPAGMSKPIASSSALRPPASRMPSAEADADATTPTTTASTQDRQRHLSRRGADRAEQRHLPRALRHDDRERVVDDEARHEEGDDREHEQEAVEDSRLSMSSWFSFVSSAPVTTSTLSAAVATATRFAARPARSPAAATTSIWLNWSGVYPTMRWASGSVNCTIDAPSGLSAVPNLAMPTTVYSWPPDR